MEINRINEINELVQLASISGMLNKKNVQTMLYAIGLDDDKELIDDARKFFGYNALGRIISQNPFDQ